MIRISNIKLPVRHNREDLIQEIARKLRVRPASLLDIKIFRQSLDARKKDQIHYVYTVDAALKEEEQILRRIKNPSVARAQSVNYQYPVPGKGKMNHPPVIVGAGPAGLFAGYFLARTGYKPLILERGDKVEDRIKSVEKFFDSGVLDPSSNIQFGEGGAGTFSDGKLHTGVHDPAGRNQLVLQTFVENGAPEEILYQAKPHLGTDVLEKIIRNMRRYILDQGGSFRFRTTFQEFLLQGNILKGIRTADGEEIPADHVILAIGHSARDTFDYLIHRSGLTVTAKPFAVGVRAEHLQSEINRAQYGDHLTDLLPAADYKLTCKTGSGRSVYSFCMCPGGYVVNSSSEPGHLCVNGMSYSGRNSDNANSAIVVAVKPSEDPVENIRFQRELEEKAYLAGQGRIVSQRFGDFESGVPSSGPGHILPVHKGETCYGNIRHILPEEICRDLSEAMHIFGTRIKGFDHPDVLLSAVETRTSSPVRIVRNERMEASVPGIYPVGEGAGYAGGITSAAIDGVKVFERICGSYQPPR